LPENYVPYWDFNNPEIPNSVKDSSAGAIASSGLLELSKLSGKEGFKNFAVNILNSLCNDYLCEEVNDGILKHGCYHKPENIGIDESLIFGDYYFVEALMKVKWRQNEGQDWQYIDR
jgi:unsaturated chondroitin disaccharide hydrolase